MGELSLGSPPGVSLEASLRLSWNTLLSGLPSGDRGRCWWCAWAGMWVCLPRILREFVVPGLEVGRPGALCLLCRNTFLTH